MAYHCLQVLKGLLLVAALCAVQVAMAPVARAQATQQRLIVKWKTSPHPHSETLTTTRAEFQQATGWTLRPRRALTERIDVLELDRPLPRAQLAQALAQLRRQPQVEYAVADERRHITVLPNDPLITATSGRTGQWYLLNVEPAAGNAIGAWDYSQGGNTIVAVVDTGVRFDHPDLVNKLLPGYDFVSCDQSNCSGSGQTFLTANDGDGWDANASDPGDWVSSTDLQNHPEVFDSSTCEVANSSWHGTRVAGLIAAATNNGIGIAGAGWNTRVLPIRALGKCGGYDSDIIAGMRWAAGLAVAGAPPNPNPAKVINLSLGSSGNCSAAYADVISTLTAIGVTVVASAGNDSAAMNVPANCSGVIGVVGMRNSGTKVGFSSLGPQATIAAPAGNCGTASGLCLYSLDTTTNLGLTTPTVNDYTDQTNYNLGTSFSAPIVAGTVALMLGANSSLTPAQIISTLRSSARPFPQTASAACQAPTGSTPLTANQAECNCNSSICGAGLLDTQQAVLAVVSAGSSSSASSSSSSTSSASSSSSGSSAPSAAASAPAAASGGGGGAFTRLDLAVLGLLLMAAASRRQIRAKSITQAMSPTK